MRKIELVPGVQSSVLGFGCAPILGAIGSVTAARALSQALDCGINHLDIARSYGYGEAEEFLGKFLRGRREQVVIASKFGIRATWKASLLRPLKPLVRVMKDRRKTAAARPAAPPSEAAVHRSDPFHERIPLTAKSMRHSLECSLKALRTDYLDLFFVHEPAGALEHLDELVEAAGALKAAGKIRGWGLAFDWGSSGALASSFASFDVLQFNNSPGAAHYNEVRQARAAAPNIFFSPFRTSLGMEPADVLTTLWEDFPRSVVLCSMFRPEHIASNAALASR
jgi:aryl-alcohol dehydrogenase-like predicted oxidoreductase